MSELLELLLYDYTVRTVALGAGVLGIVSGVLGCFAVLRRQSLVGDALAHAALPGVAIAFLLAGDKTSEVLLLGAAVSGWLGALAVLGIVHGSRVKSDAALGIVLSVFFGFGIVLLTRIQHTGDAGQSGLNHFLFGQAAVLLQRDVVLMAVLGGATLLITALLYKELKLLTFDAAFGTSLGYPAPLLSVLLTGLITVAVVIGLQTVGVVLMAAMLIAPASAARQWTSRLGRMIALAAAFGAFAGVSGGVLSSLDARLPTGPLVVLIITLIVLLSLAFAPGRGVVWTALERRRTSLRLRRQVALADLSAYGTADSLSTSALSAAVRSQLGWLRREGVLVPGAAGRWRLTSDGERRTDEAARQRAARRAELARVLAVPEEEVHVAPAELESSAGGEVVPLVDEVGRAGGTP